MAEQWRHWIWVLGCAGLLVLGGCQPAGGARALKNGLRALEHGQDGQAIRLFQKALNDTSRADDQAVIYNCLGVVFHKIGQRDNALRMLAQAARLDPRLPEPVYNEALILLAGGQEQAALVCFEKAAALDGRDTRALEYLGYLYRKNHQPEAARRALAEAHQRAPRSARILTAQALLDLDARNVDQAIVLLQQALEQDDRYAPAIFDLAVVQQTRNHREAALAYFQDYLRLAPKATGADRARRAVHDLTPVPMPPPVESQARRPPPAAVAPTTVIAKAAEAAPAPALPPTLPSADELMKVAKILVQQGRTAAAVNNYLRAAQEAQRSGRDPFQEQALREALALAPQDARVHYELGRYLAARRQNAEALAHLKNAVAFSTNWFEAQLTLARLAADSDELDTARLVIKQAGQARADQPEVVWTLARFCENNAGLADLAVDYYAGFAQRFPQDQRAAAARERLQILPGGSTRLEQNAETKPGETNAVSWWRWLGRSQPAPPAGTNVPTN